MPQFDFYSFIEQVFLVLIVFSIFYFSLLRFYLVVILKTIKMRRKLNSILTFFKSKKITLKMF